MARIRSVHPGLFTDEAFAGLSSDAQVFLIGIWTESDDQGVFEWKPLTLRMRLRPTKDGPVEPLLAELEAANCIRKFDHAGRQYGAVRNFAHYQRPKTPKHIHPILSDIRKFVGSCDISSDAVTVDGGEDDTMNYSRDVTAAERKRRQRARERNKTDVDGNEFGTCHGSSVTEEEVSRLMEDGGGREGEDINQTSSSEAARDAEFDDWYAAFPKHVGRGQAIKAYRLARKKADAETLLAAAQRYAGAVAGKDRQFTKHPATWLNGECWLDEGDCGDGHDGIPLADGYDVDDPYRGAIHE